MRFSVPSYCTPHLSTRYVTLLSCRVAQIDEQLQLWFRGQFS